MKKLTICFIAKTQMNHTIRWVESLAKNDCNIHLISSHKIEIANVTIHSLPIYSQNIFQQLLNIIKIRIQMRKINPDIVHLFGLFDVNSLGTMWLIQGLQNLIISVIGTDIVPGESKETTKEIFIKKYLLNRAKKIFASSKYLADQTKKYVSLKNKVQVLYWGVNTSTLIPKKREDYNHEIIIGFVKRIHFLSGPDILLKAFHYAHNMNKRIARLKIAGDGPMIEEIKELILSLGLSDVVELLGWLHGEEDLKAFFHSIDIFVMPSRRESFGMAACEAAASGLPIISSRFGGIPEIVIHNKTGLLVDPENVKDFGKAMVVLGENEEMRLKFGIAGRSWIEKMFCWDRSISQMIHQYRQIKKLIPFQ